MSVDRGRRGHDTRHRGGPRRAETEDPPGCRELWWSDVWIDGTGAIGQLTEGLHHEMGLGDASAPLAIEGLVLQILAAMLRIRTPRESKAPAWLARFRGALHDRSCDAVQIAELAQECGAERSSA